MSISSPIAVFGAGGKAGTEVLHRARQGGLAVRAFENNLPEPGDRVEGVEYVQCDVLKDSFADQLRGCGAVISALGIGFSPSTAIDPPPLYTDGTRHLLEAMRETDITRIVVISAAFVVHQPSIPAWFELTARSALFNILEQMGAMEDMLEQEVGLDWTSARPGWLLDEPYTGEAIITDERLAERCFRCRHGDLAESLIEFVAEGTWLKAKPAIGRPEAERFEEMSALKVELELD